MNETAVALATKLRDVLDRLDARDGIAALDGSDTPARPTRPTRPAPPARRSEAGRERAVAAAGARLRALLSAIEPLELVPAEAAGLYRELTRTGHAIEGTKTLLAARVAESNEWRRAGCREPAEHLARTTGTTITDARDQLHVSRQVEHLPETRRALQQGTVSARQASVVVSAATTDPTAETHLLATAAATTVAELRQECLRVRAAADPDPDATHRRIHRSRALRQHTDAEGAWHLHACGPAEAGARLNTAIEALVDATFRARRDPDEREPRDAYAFDALVALAERDRASDATDGTARSRRHAARYRAIIRVDHAALVRGQVEPGETCEIAGIGPIPARRARDLLGDSVCHLVVTKGHDVANVTHLGRGPTAAQRVALAWRQPTCAVAGCVRSRVEIDHRDEWSATHETRLDGLDPLCAYHHRLKTRDDWALVRGVGNRPMVPPDHPDHPDPRRGPRRRTDAGRRAPPATVAAR